MPDFTTIRQNALPLNFDDEAFIIGDKAAMVTKQNSMLSELVATSVGWNESITDLNALSAELSDSTVMQARLKNRLTYSTKAGMDSAGAPPGAGTDASELAEVWNDPSEANNAVYGWNGSAWIISSTEDWRSRFIDISRSIAERFNHTAGGSYTETFARGTVTELAVPNVTEPSAGIHGYSTPINGVDGTLNGVILALRTSAATKVNVDLLDSSRQFIAGGSFYSDGAAEVARVAFARRVVMESGEVYHLRVYCLDLAVLFNAPHASYGAEDTATHVEQYYNNSGGWQQAYPTGNYGQTFALILDSQGEIDIYSELDKLNSRYSGPVYTHPDGTAEENGDAVYDGAAILGFYQQMPARTVFNRISFKAWSLPNSSVEWRIWVRTYATGFSMSAVTPTLSGTIASGQFPTTETDFTLSLPSDVPANAGQYVFIMLRSSTAGVSVKRWLTTSANRHGLPLTASNDWSSTMLFGSGSFSQAAFRLSHTTEYGLAVDAQIAANAASLAGVESDVFDVVADTAELQLQRTAALPILTAPNTIYATVGTELIIQHDSVCSDLSTGLQGSQNYSVSMTCDIGKNYDRFYSVTATGGQVGAHTLTIRLFSANGNLVTTRFVTLSVGSSTAPAVAKNILMIGDSLTAADTTTVTCRGKFATLGGTVPTFVGTQGTAPSKHEGYGGATLAWFVSSSSPFWNSGSGQLDIANYRATNSIASVITLATIQLGVNDVFGEALKSSSALDTIVNNAKTLCNALQADNGACKIIIALPTLCGNTSGGFATNYGASFSRQYYEANIFALRVKLMAAFDGGAYNAQTRVGSAGLAIDRYYGYELNTIQVSARITSTEQRHVNAVHPVAAGYQQIGDAMFSDILAAL